MRTIEKHSLWLRINHWLNVPFLFLMIWSGWLIYWADDVYPGFFPAWFYRFFRIPGRLAEGLSIHFFVAWFFVLNGLIYLVWLFVSGHWREIYPTTAPQQGKFNAMQRLAYSFVIPVAIISVLSGFAIYKPVQLGWLARCFGGYRSARLVHFSAMAIFCFFIAVHVLQVLRAGWNNLRAMVAGFEVQNDR